MNSLEGHISGIEVNGGLSLVTVAIGEDLELKSIVIETPATASYLAKGSIIKVLFKETEVILGTVEDHSISLQNRIKGRIKLIEEGTLLSRVVLTTGAGEVIAIVSSNAVEQLKLKEGSEVMALIKLNEIMLAE